MKKLIFLAILLIPVSLFAADAAKGKTIYDQRCASCHGPKGAGDGPAAAALPAEMKPRNLKGEERKVAKDTASFTELLKKGGPAFGLNPLMAPQADLSDEDLANLIAYVDSL